MILKRFNVQIIIRIIAIIVTTAILTLLWGNEKFAFNQIILGILLVVQTAALIHFLNKTNRDLRKLLDSIRNNDFSITFLDKDLGKNFNSLHKSMTAIVDAFTSMKIEKEVQFQFLKTLVSQLNIGVISLEQDVISLVNPKAEQLLNIKGIRSWSLFRDKNPGLHTRIEDLGTSGRTLIEVRLADGHKIVAAEVITLTAIGKELRIITFEDINSEIEQKEIEAWQRLIRIMTHEIMNSVTPITSLTETMQRMLVTTGGETKSPTDLPQETLSDIRFALQTIQRRSEGLSGFVENYKKLSRVPTPEHKTVILKELLLHVRSLLAAPLSENNITLTIAVYPKLLPLQCDPVLTEQVLINLVGNAIYSMEGKSEKRIEINGFADENRVYVEVTDTGHGIPDKVLPEIFVPFYSTRKNGSGIGLSLSKQIMRSQNGNIKVKHTSTEGTCFQLHFPR